jgi:hypothetical protein
MVIPRILIGIALLVLGRKLFWLFVGSVGFLVGAYLATTLLQGQPDWLTLVVALAAGLLGALLAFVVQRFAVGVAGFLLGGYLANTLLDALPLDISVASWLVFFVGGTLCAALIGFVFEWALIVLSAITGALLIVQSSPLDVSWTMVLFALLLAGGVVTQYVLMQREQR